MNIYDNHGHFLWDGGGRETIESCGKDQGKTRHKYYNRLWRLEKMRIRSFKWNESTDIRNALLGFPPGSSRLQSGFARAFAGLPPWGRVSLVFGWLAQTAAPRSMASTFCFLPVRITIGAARSRRRRCQRYQSLLFVRRQQARSNPAHAVYCRLVKCSGVARETLNHVSVPPYGDNSANQVNKIDITT